VLPILVKYLKHRRANRRAQAAASTADDNTPTS